jgi:hypothetical protein
MFVPELLNDRCSGRRFVAKITTDLGHPKKLRKHFVWKPGWIGGELCRNDQSGQFPVAGRAILPARDFRHLAVARGRNWGGFYSRYGFDVSESKRSKVRKVQSPYRTCRVDEGVAPFVSIAMGVGELPDPDTIKNNENDFPRCSVALHL